MKKQHVHAMQSIIFYVFCIQSPKRNKTKTKQKNCCFYYYLCRDHHITTYQFVDDHNIQY